jgi:hypothetical protein
MIRQYLLTASFHVGQGSDKNRQKETAIVEMAIDPHCQRALYSASDDSGSLLSHLTLRIKSHQLEPVLATSSIHALLRTDAGSSQHRENRYAILSETII